MLPFCWLFSVPIAHLPCVFQRPPPPPRQSVTGQNARRVPPSPVLQAPPVLQSGSGLGALWAPPPGWRAVSMSPSHAGQPLLSSCCPAGSPAPAPASEGAGDLGSVPRWPPSPQQARASPSLTQTSGRPLPAPPMAAVPPCPQLWALPAWCICTEHLRAHLCPLAGVSVREGASSLATSAGVAAAVLRVPPLSPQASLRWAAQAQQGWTETSCLLPGHSHTHILYFLPISTLRGSCENSTGHAPTPTFESQLVTVLSPT